MTFTRILYGLAYTAILGYFAGKIYRKVSNPRKEIGFPWKPRDNELLEKRKAAIRERQLAYFKRQLANGLAIPSERISSIMPAVGLAGKGTADAHALLEDIARKHGVSMF